MITYHPNLVAKRSASGSADMVETVISDQMSRHCDTELEDRKPIFLHILAHDVASPYQVWLQKVQHQRRYHSDEHSLEFLNFSVTLTLTTTEQSNFFHKTFHFMLVCHQTKFTCKRVSNSDNISKSHILIILFLTVSTRCWLMMLHHRTKFGNKMFCDSENIVRKNIY